jgi:TP901 family phage tail tape measure protein
MGSRPAPAALKSKFESLNEKLVLQKQAVEQYEKALSAANDSLEKAATRNDDLKSKLDSAKSAQAGLKDEVESATDAWNAAKKAYGENSNEANALGLAMIDLKEQHAAATEEVKRLDGQVNASNNSLRTQADNVSKATTNLNNAKTAYGDAGLAIKATKKALDNSESSWKKAQDGFEAVGKKATDVGKGIQEFGKDFSLYVPAPLAALGGFAYNAATKYESAFAGVRKTVDGTEEDFESLNAGLLELSERTPLSYTDLAAIMEMAGQMGVEGVDNLLKYTETMAALGVSTNLSATDASMALAKFANITGTPIEEIDRLGAVIVALGNNYATTEADIVAMATKMASAGELAGLSETEIMALSAALSSMGIEAEAGGSAAAKLMKQMQVAAETGDTKFADAMGLTAEGFKEMWDAGAADTMLAFFQSLSDMNASGQTSAVKMLDDMGLTEIRLSNLILASTNNTEGFASALGMANAALTENVSLVDEANKRYETQESQNQMLANKASNVASNFGDNITKMLDPLMDKLNEVLDWFGSFDEDTQSKIVTAFTIFAVGGPVVTAVGGTVKAIGDISTGIGKVIGAKDAILAAITGPAGWTTLAIARIAAVGIEIANMKSEMDIITERAAAIEFKIDENSKNETMQAIAQVRREIEGLSGEESTEQGAGVVATVKAGYGTSDMYGQALGCESGTMQKQIANAGADYQAQIDKLNAEIVKDVEAGNQANADVLAKQRDELYAQWDAEILAIKDAHSKSISEIVTGMASQYPEAQARIVDAMEQYSALKALAEYDPTEMTVEEIRAAAQKLLGMEGMEKALAEMGQTSESIIAMCGGLPIQIVDGLRVSLMQSLTGAAESAADSPISTVLNAMLSDTGTVEGLDFSAIDGTLADGIAMLDFKAAAEQAQSKGGEIGQYLTTGLGVGISGNTSATNKDVLALRDAVVNQTRSAFDMGSPSRIMAREGEQIPAGLAQGIDRGAYRVKDAMVRMVRDAVKAAKSELKIESPSRVFRDEVGVMIPRGAAIGIEQETARQQRAVSNAFRALVQPALAGAQGGTATATASRTNNYSSTLSLDGANIYLNDKVDVRALSIELAALQTAQQRALGRVN